MEIKDLYVKAVRTFNDEEIYGKLIGYHQPTRKMKEEGQYVGIVDCPDYGRCFDVYPYSITYLNDEFNIYEFIS